MSINQIKILDIMSLIAKHAPKDGSIRDLAPEAPLVYTDYGPASLKAYVASPYEGSAGRLNVVLQTMQGDHTTEFNSGEFSGEDRFGFFFYEKNRSILCPRSDKALEPLTGYCHVGSESQEVALPTKDEIKDRLKFNVDEKRFDTGDLINFRYGAKNSYQLILDFIAKINSSS